MSGLIVTALLSLRERLAGELTEVDAELARHQTAAAPVAASAEGVKVHWTQTEEGKKRLRAREAKKKKEKAKQAAKAQVQGSGPGPVQVQPVEPELVGAGVGADEES